LLCYQFIFGRKQEAVAAASIVVVVIIIMNRITQTAFPARYIQGPGAIQMLPQLVQSFGDSGLLIVDPFVHEKILPTLDLKSGSSGVKLHTIVFGGECTETEIARLVQAGKDQKVKCVIGLGGGKTLDTAKAVSAHLQVAIIIAATAASTDAPTSARAVIYNDEGKVLRYLDLPSNPNVVLLDTDIIVKAPVRLLVSGMGDALSTYFEANSCRIKVAANSTCGAGHAHPGSMTSYVIAETCYKTLLEYGPAALVSAQAGAVTPAFEHVVEANTLLSGVGFESAGLGCAHAVHNGLSELPECHQYYHGEKVAIGVLTGLFFADASKELIDEVYTFCERVGLPTTLADIGVKDVTPEKLDIIANRTVQSDESIHNELKPVSAAAVKAALMAADAEGRRRKQK
jgi:glycerol dehydrogenase